VTARREAEDVPVGQNPNAETGGDLREFRYFRESKFERVD
jgi:hypothetical protein